MLTSVFINLKKENIWFENDTIVKGLVLLKKT